MSVVCRMHLDYFFTTEKETKHVYIYFLRYVAEHCENVNKLKSLERVEHMKYFLM